MKQPERITATQTVWLTVIGGGVLTGGFFVAALAHFHHALLVGCIIYATGLAVAAESTLRLRANIRKGKFSYSEIQALRSAVDSRAGKISHFVFALILLVLFRPSSGAHDTDWNLLILALSFTAGQISTTLHTPYDNPDASVRYRKQSWSEWTLIAFALLAWGLSWPVATFASAWHPYLLAASAIFFGILWLFSWNSRWPEQDDRPYRMPQRPFKQRATAYTPSAPTPP